MSFFPALRPGLLSAATLFTSHTIASNSFIDPLTSFDQELWWKSNGWSNGFPFNNRWEESSIITDNNGMHILLNKAPTTDSHFEFRSGELRSHNFYGYGCFEAEIKPIAKSGVITSFFLFAGPYDKPEGGNGQHNEIDIEFLGNNTNAVQLNFWTNDDQYLSSNETLIYLDFDASEAFHRYGIKWTKRAIRWYVDGKLVHHAKNSGAVPTPSAKDSKLRIMANVWPTDERISNWAGLFDTNSKLALTASYRNIRYKAGRKCKFKP
ncbi:family 16 glycosylhydrolase [Photobacterium kasasachensis]|uniref:family 16 glycosylhydrolase n=1 Tax=Photobacterium kasasachensis TaxID=2910240 RepID=UPI003D125791